MTFDITEQALDAIARKTQITAEDILGLMAHDLFEDIKNQGNNGGYNKLPVADAGAFVDNLVRLTMNISRIYKNNQALFSDEETKARWDKANKKFGDFIYKLDVINADIESLQKKMDEADRRAAEYKRKLAGMPGLETKLKEKEQEVAKLKNILDQAAQVDADIAELKDDKIPDAEQQLVELTGQYNKSFTEYTDLKNKCTSANVRLIALRKEYDKENNLYADLIATEDELQKKLQTFKVKKTTVQSNIDSLNNEIRTTGDRISYLESIIAGLKQTAENLKIQKSELEARNRELDGIVQILTRQVQEENDRKTTLENRNKALEEELKRLKANENDLIGRLESGQRLKKETEDNIYRLNIEISVLEDEIRKLSEQNDQLNQKYVRLVGDKTLLDNEHNRLVGDISKLEAYNTELEKANKNLTQQKVTEEEKLENLQAEEKEINQRIDELQKQIAQVKNNNTNLDKKIEKFSSDLESEQDRYEDLMDQITKVRTEYGAQKSLTKQAMNNHKEQISAYQSEQRWLSDMIESLLEDRLLIETYGFEANVYIEELNNRITEHKSGLNKQIEDEMQLYNEILTKLEEGR